MAYLIDAITQLSVVFEDVERIVRDPDQADWFLVSAWSTTLRERVSHHMLGGGSPRAARCRQPVSMAFWAPTGRRTRRLNHLRTSPPGTQIPAPRTVVVVVLLLLLPPLAMRGAASSAPPPSVRKRRCVVEP